MIFKDRQDAGEKLSVRLLKDKNLLRNRKDFIIVSLLRGGVVVGKAIAKRLNIMHIPLAVIKIPAPHNPELAIGAVCFDTVYLQENIIRQLDLKEESINSQISIAKTKHKEYIKKFSLEKIEYRKKIKNKIIIIVDDGVATGATVKAANEFIKSKKATKIILAIPVVPADFDTKGFDQVFILHRDPFFSSVSQFYERFSQVEKI